MIRNLSFRVQAARCLLAVLFCALWSVSCSVDNRPAGGLVVALETDMSVPKDIDRILVEASQGGKVIFSAERLVGEGHDLMPLQLRITTPGNNDPVLIRAIGFQGPTTKVERSVITPMPTNWLATVRLPLNYLCLGKVDAAGVSLCGADQTCKQGECASAQLPSELLVRYEPNVRVSKLATTAADGGVDAGALTAHTDDERCFDVASCFYQSLDVEVEPVTCSFALPTEILPEQLNIALRLPLGQPGICEGGSCFVILDEDTEGYQVEAGRVYVPLAVCDRMLASMGGAISLGLDCPKKTLDNPICGPWTSVKTPVPPLGTTPDGTNPGIVVGTQPSRPSLLQGACSGAARQACGMCGTQSRDCKDGTWTTWAACMPGGACTPGMSEACPTGGRRNCGGDCTWGECMTQTCMGPSSRACGNCGTQTRTCTGGMWSEWTACNGQGACVPNATQACATGGTQTCGGSCQWGECGSGACTGPASESCGNCGTRTRVCDAATKKYGEWSACQAEGVCMPDATRACGLSGMQTCRGDCQWGEGCANQMCEGESVRLCGNCGTQSRTCNTENGTWTEWGECTDQGECAPNAARTCGRGGVQICGGNCKWDPTCAGQRCMGTAARSCGNCGIQLRLCNTFTGEFPDWSTVPCVNQGECVGNTSRDCGNGGKQFCGADCRWQSGCGNQMCPGRAPRHDCGNCGTQSAVCDGATGKWSDTQYGACMNEGCKPGEEQACGAAGSNAARVCSNACTWGACLCDPAKKPTDQCEKCGTRSVTCNTQGVWEVGACTGQGECEKNTSGMCGVNLSGTHMCSATCKWGACSGEKIDCDQTKKPPTTCGFCGTQAVTCDDSNGMWKVGACMNPGECAKNTTGMCGTNNTGTRMCSATCEWGQCTGVKIDCDQTKKPGTTCGFCGTQTVMCDDTNGTWKIGTCVNPGECAKNTTGTCGTNNTGTRMCSATCEWGQCTGVKIDCDQTKKPGTTCGFCGTQTVTCDDTNGSWKVGACVNPGECAKNTTGMCGTNNTGTRMCSSTCEWGPCTGEKIDCDERAKPDAACGNCGTRTVTCDFSNGSWKTGTCTGAGECAKNTSEKCGVNLSGTRTCSNTCSWGTCMGEVKVCTGTKPSVACGRCGTKEVTCVDGEYVVGSTCLGEHGECTPPDSQTCPTGTTGTQTCSSSCAWVGSCTPVVEPPPVPPVPTTVRAPSNR